MKRLLIMTFIMIILIVLNGCTKDDNGQLQHVGMLTDGTSTEHGWQKLGHDGLKAIEKKFNVNTYVKTNITSREKTIEAVQSLTESGVNLIIGHGNDYGKYFAEIANNYPDVQFIYLNGGYIAENVTSLNLNSHAMGFFSGMVAGRMTDTNEIGVIGAYEWQPEIEGFFEGVKYQNHVANVHISYLNDWKEVRDALDIYNQMMERNIDVVYPTGNAYSREIIQQASEDGIYAIGYSFDQSYLAPSTVLTSTIQKIDQLYLYAATKFNKRNLTNDVLTFDFKEGIISLGTFSENIPDDFIRTIKKDINEYKETNTLPHTKE